MLILDILYYLVHVYLDIKQGLALYQDKREQGNREYLKLAKDEHLVRLHIGLEDPKDLIDDLKRSIKHVK